MVVLRLVFRLFQLQCSQSPGSLRSASALFPVSHCRADNSDESMKNFQTDFVGLNSMYILVLYGHFGEERNHKHKSNGNQSKTSVMIWL